MRILITGAHPDDIEAQMGGTIAKHTAQGDYVLLLHAFPPFQDSDSQAIPGAYENRIKETYRAADVLGAETQFLNVDPYQIRFDRYLVQKLDKFVRRFKPDTVYTCWDHDSHQDHVNMSLSTLAVARKNNFDVYMYEQVIPGGIMPYGFVRNMYVELNDEQMVKKLSSVACYKSQVALFPGWLEAIEGRARLRGFEINTKYAEAFCVVKQVKKNNF